jgi:glycosyltransferase involved in cell wall biosynthesis
VYLGRICYEKGAHLAIEIAERLRRRIVLIGGVYPFAAHQQYFRDFMQPHLGPQVEWIDSPSFDKKHEIVANAAAVVIPSLVEETSSLVAMEAAACGTPVLAFPRGALPEIVQEGETGFLRDSVEELVQCASKLNTISSRRCREHAERDFSSHRMASEYLELYRRLTHD